MGTVKIDITLTLGVMSLFVADIAATMAAAAEVPHTLTKRIHRYEREIKCEESKDIKGGL